MSRITDEGLHVALREIAGTENRLDRPRAPPSGEGVCVCCRSHLSFRPFGVVLFAGSVFEEGAVNLLKVGSKECLGDARAARVGVVVVEKRPALADNVHTTTCTPAILGYYHLARALGDICEIKPAVLRTMDISTKRWLGSPPS